MHPRILRGTGTHEFQLNVNEFDVYARRTHSSSTSTPAELTWPSASGSRRHPRSPRRTSHPRDRLRLRQRPRPLPRPRRPSPPHRRRRRRCRRRHPPSFVSFPSSTPTPFLQPREGLIGLPLLMFVYPLLFRRPVLVVMMVVVLLSVCLRLRLRRRRAGQTAPSRRRRLALVVPAANRPPSSAAPVQKKTNRQRRNLQRPRDSINHCVFFPLRLRAIFWADRGQKLSTISGIHIHLHLPFTALPGQTTAGDRPSVPLPLWHVSIATSFCRPCGGARLARPERP